MKYEMLSVGIFKGADWFALSVEVFRQVVVLFCPGGLGGVHLDGYVVQVAKVAKGLIKRISECKIRQYDYLAGIVNLNPVDTVNMKGLSERAI